VAEWNDKPTFMTRAQKQAGYDALFKIAKFSTVFGYASIDIDGDMAIVRTFHHKGASVLENGKPVPDYNREVFIRLRLRGTEPLPPIRHRLVHYRATTLRRVRRQSGLVIEGVSTARQGATPAIKAARCR
jgi:hypothetical protein